MSDDPDDDPDIGHLSSGMPIAEVERLQRIEQAARRLSEACLEHEGCRGNCCGWGADEAQHELRVLLGLPMSDHRTKAADKLEEAIVFCESEAEVYKTHAERLGNPPFGGQFSEYEAKIVFTIRRDQCQAIAKKLREIANRG